MGYQLIPVRMAIVKKFITLNARDDVKKREALNFVGDMLYWYSHYGKQYQFISVAQFCLIV